jgi:hypothetical protein
MKEINNFIKTCLGKRKINDHRIFWRKGTNCSKENNEGLLGNDKDI